MKKTIAILLSALTLLALVACDPIDYRKANELYAAGDYEAAMEAYTALGEYKDAESRILSCRYNIANGLLSDKQYQEAKEIYTELGDYEEAAEKILQCDYALATVDYNNGLYEQALDAFCALDGYSDSKELADECRYILANEQYDNGSYKEALEYFTALGDYKNSKKLAELAEREYRMHEDGDYEFLAAMEELLSDHMLSMEFMMTEGALSAEENLKLETHLDRVLAFDPSEAHFYNEDLNEALDKYYSGLNSIRYAEMTHPYCPQISSLAGAMLCMEALMLLQEQYGFMVDNAELNAWLGEYERVKSFQTAVLSIYANLMEQSTAERFSWKLDMNNYTLHCYLKNPTEYVFSALFRVTLYDKERNEVMQLDIRAKDAVPNKSFKVISRVDRVRNLHSLSWVLYITEAEIYNGN